MADMFVRYVYMKEETCDPGHINDFDNMLKLYPTVSKSIMYTYSDKRLTKARYICI